MRFFLASLLLVNGPVFGCNEVALDSSRIAVAGGSLTEIVYLLGAGDRIVATDTTSNFPEAASTFPSVGYVRNLSAEGLLSLRPTLILGEDDMGPPEVLVQVRRTGTQIVRVPEEHTAAGILDKVRCVAHVLNLSPTAEKHIAAQLGLEVSSLRRIAVNTDTTAPRVVFLFGLQDGAPLVAGGTTSGNGLLQMAGARNVFADIDGWKPVSLEAMAAADPEFIVIPQRSVDSAGGIEAIAKHPAIRLTAAGRNRRIIAMDGMAMLGFGPRTLQAALALAAALHSGELTLADTGNEDGQ